MSISDGGLNGATTKGERPWWNTVVIFPPVGLTEQQEATAVHQLNAKDVHAYFFDGALYAGRQRRARTAGTAIAAVTTVARKLIAHLRNIPYGAAPHPVDVHATRVDPPTA